MSKHFFLTYNQQNENRELVHDATYKKKKIFHVHKVNGQNEEKTLWRTLNSLDPNHSHIRTHKYRNNHTKCIHINM